MLQNKVDGITRTLIFDGMGQRTDVNFDILELTPAGNQTVSIDIILPIYLLIHLLIAMRRLLK